MSHFQVFARKGRLRSAVSSDRKIEDENDEFRKRMRMIKAELDKELQECEDLKRWLCDGKAAVDRHDAESAAKFYEEYKLSPADCPARMFALCVC